MQNPAFLESRKQQLDLLLDALLRVPDVALSQHVFEFLCPENVRVRLGSMFPSVCYVSITNPMSFRNGSKAAKPNRSR